LKLISWNVAGRTKLLDEQARALIRQEPDVVALQEVRASTLPRWRRELAAAGLEVALDSSAFASGRRLFNLTAARWPAIELPSPPGPQPERVLSALVETPYGPLEIHNAHVPPAPGNGLAKVETCEAIHYVLDRPAPDRHRILCGDLNTPRSESVDGLIETFARNHPEHLERWDAAERSVLTGLTQWGMSDVFRQLNGYERRDVSWVQHTRYQRKARFRLDHVIASASLGAVYCDYHHGWRDEGLSDHAAIEAIFEPETLE
jgi:exonuclease III